MNIEHFLSESISAIVNELFGLTSTPKDIILQKTKKEFEGDYTLVTFPYIKAAKATPEKTGELIGEKLLVAQPVITGFNVVKGFLNFSLSHHFWLTQFKEISQDAHYGIKPALSSGKQIMLEYSSPNTNKPLHLGHVRNNLLGYSVATIIKTQGHEVIKVNLVNDRGIHICKSMLAWKLFGNGERPQTNGLKGDHLVGKYYVEFEKVNQREALEDLKKAINNPFKVTDDNTFYIDLDKTPQPYLNVLIARAASNIHKISNDTIDSISFKSVVQEVIANEPKDKKDPVKELIEDYFLMNTALMAQAREMLLKWEAGDKETIDLWKMMNDWVYEGFQVTYKKLGVDFDKFYYESNTYLLGKEIVQEGLSKHTFYKKENGSICIDLTKDGLDEKVVLRSDGTSVYITQDLGTAIERFKEFPKLSQMIYTVGNEQDYHFKVLFKILEKLGYDWAKECYHLSYGMVELPEGKMKSREGTVVDADDLIDGMVLTAKELTDESGKIEHFLPEEKEHLYQTIGMGALKYFILKVDPKKKMLFDPKESIDLHGNTGPFIQYAHARIKSILKDYQKPTDSISISDSISLHEKERELIKLQYDFSKILEEAAHTYNPAVVANYIYELAKLFNQFYNECSVLKEENVSIKEFRIKLIETTSSIIKNGMLCLGIEVPERM